jgi:hypothetical protein
MNDKIITLEWSDEGSDAIKNFKVRGITVRPLRFIDLLNNPMHNKSVFTMSGLGQEVLVSDFPESSVGESANFTFKLDSSFSNKVFALLPGGWLPSGVATCNSTTFLLDRCVVSEFRTRFSGGHSLDKNGDFLDFLNVPGIRLHIGQYALEGNSRSTPDAILVSQQLEEAVKYISAALPNAEVWPGPLGLKGILGLISDREKIRNAELNFLLWLGRELVGPVGRSRQADMWQRIIQKSDSFGLPRFSLALVLALGALTAPQKNNVCRNILKPSSTFDSKDAYNVYADLQFITCYLAILAHYPEEKPSLLTGDRNLALFWAGLRPSNFVPTPTGFTCSYSPVEQLIPYVDGCMASIFHG